MRDLLPWWAWVLVAFYGVGAAYTWIVLEDCRCLHHWHAADAMIRVKCCWCGADRDGWPKDRTLICRSRFRTPRTTTPGELFMWADDDWKHIGHIEDITTDDA